MSKKKKVLYFGGKAFISDKEELLVEQIFAIIQISAKEIIYVTNQNNVYEQREGVFYGSSPEKVKEYMSKKYAVGLSDEHAIDNINEKFGIDLKKLKNAERTAVPRILDKATKEELLFDASDEMIISQSTSEDGEVYYLTDKLNVYLYLHNKDRFDVRLFKGDNYPKTLKDQKTSLQRELIPRQTERL